MTATTDRVRQRIPVAGWLRIVFRSLSMIVWLLTCLPLYLLWYPFARHNPWVRRFMGGVAAILGVRISVRGNRPQDGAFLLSNHVSWLDIPILCSVTGTAFVAQDGLATHSWLRWLSRLNDTVFIARDRRQTVATQVEQVREAIRDTGALTIFPESTTADGVSLLPFKSSLLSALTPAPKGVAVYPVWIDFGTDAAEIAWVGDEPGFDNFLKIASRERPFTVNVNFLSPLDGDALDDRKAMAAAARRAIEQAMASASAQTTDAAART